MPASPPNATATDQTDTDDVPTERTPPTATHATTRQAKKRGKVNTDENAAGLSEVVYHALLRIGYHQAQKRGVDSNDWDDCALEFVCKMAHGATEQPVMDMRHTGFEPWAHRCAANHAHDYRRRQSRYDAQFANLLDLKSGAFRGEAGDTLPNENELAGYYFATSDASKGNSGEYDPLRRAMIAEFWSVATSLFARLEPGQRLVLTACILDGENAPVVAAQINKTPEAVRLILSRTRKRVRNQMVRHGIGESDLRDYSVPPDLPR